MGSVVSRCSEADAGGVDARPAVIASDVGQAESGGDSASVIASGAGIGSAARYACGGIAWRQSFAEGAESFGGSFAADGGQSREKRSWEFIINLGERPGTRCPITIGRVLMIGYKGMHRRCCPAVPFIR